MRDGIVAEFDGPEELERAFARLKALGLTRLRSWTPYPVRSVVTQLPESIVPWIMLAAGLSGAALGYLVQWWCNAYDYRLDVGGRPFHSVPAYIPIAFESGVLAASIAGFLSILGLSGLPRLYHPMFEVDGFERASVDRFWIGVDASDPRFDHKVREVLESSGALRCEGIGSAKTVGGDG
jgi:Protein of unknown function (DUF3341)